MSFVKELRCLGARVEWMCTSLQTWWPMREMNRLVNLSCELRRVALMPWDRFRPGLDWNSATLYTWLTIHLFTQSFCNQCGDLPFWKEYGLTCVLAREVSMEELAEIRKRTDLRSSLRSWSQRVPFRTLYPSNHMSDRQPWWLFSILSRWKYDLTICHLAKNARVSKTSRKNILCQPDMCMIENIPDMIDNGVDSLKIEGRMNVHYVSTVANCYKAASRMSYGKSRSLLLSRMIWSMNCGRLSTWISYWFYYQRPTENGQLLLGHVVRFLNTNL